MGNMNEFIYHPEFFRRLQDDVRIFGGVTITDFQSLQRHIRALEGYAAHVQACIEAGEMPKPFDAFRDEFLYPHR